MLADGSILLHSAERKYLPEIITMLARKMFAVGPVQRGAIENHIFLRNTFNRTDITYADSLQNPFEIINSD